MKRKKSIRSRAESTSFFESRLFKIAAKLVFGLIIVFIILTCTQCSIEKPEAPSWNTSVVVPLVNRSYSMEELIDRMDQDEIEMDSSGQISYKYSWVMDTILLNEDELQTADISYAMSEQLGDIEILGPTVDPARVYFSGISGLGLLIPGGMMRVPDTTFLAIFSLDDLGTFSSATFSAGYININLDNHLGLNLDQVEIDLVNGSTDALLASGTYTGTINDGGSATVPIPVTGKTLPSNIKVVGSFHTPIDTVSEISQKYIIGELAFSSNARVSAATAKVPQFSRSLSQPVNLDEDNLIDSAALASGQLKISINNATRIRDSLVITLPDLVNASGAPYRLLKRLIPLTVIVSQ